MRNFLINIIRLLGHWKVSVISFIGVLFAQILFLVGNGRWPDFSKVTTIMPDLHPNYNHKQLAEILSKYATIKPALFAAYSVDVILPLSLCILLLSLFSLLLKHQFKTYNPFLYPVLIFPILSLTFDYLENIIIISSTLLTPGNPPDVLLLSITRLKFLFTFLSYITLVLLGLVALMRKFNNFDHLLRNRG